MSIKVKSRNEWWRLITSHFPPLASTNIKPSLHGETSKASIIACAERNVTDKIVIIKYDESFEIGVNKIIFFCTMFSRDLFVYAGPGYKVSYQR